MNYSHRFLFAIFAGAVLSGCQTSGRMKSPPVSTEFRERDLQLKAKRGSSKEAEDLGLYYLYTRHDHKRAQLWFLKAAKAGRAQAMERYAIEMLREASDLADEALTWATLAERAGDKSAKTTREHAEAVLRAGCR